MSSNRHNRAGTTVSFMYCCLVLPNSKEGRSMEPRQLRLPGFTRFWAGGLRSAPTFQNRSRSGPLAAVACPSRGLTHKLAPSSAHSFRIVTGHSGWTKPKPRLRCLSCFRSSEQKHGTPETSVSGVYSFLGPGIFRSFRARPGPLPPASVASTGRATGTCSRWRS